MADKELRKLAAVMFTDIQGYTAFVQQDEAGALKKVATHRKFLEQYTAEYNGKVIAFYGDGSLSIYESALDAVHCGMAMQKAYKGDHPIPVRIGIHVGDIVFRDETVFGDGVNIASRLQTSGIPGSVYISDRVQSELVNHPEIKTKSIGKKRLKNVTTPVEIFVVTNEGMSVPSLMTKMPELRNFYRYIPVLLIGIATWWFINRPFGGDWFENGFTGESISVPVLTNNTGDPSLDHIGGMAAHWITKELSSTPEANVVSAESASEIMQLAGVSLATPKGRARYKSLTGSINIVEAFYARIGPGTDSLMMSGYVKNLETGKILQSLEDVKCTSANPMGCIQAMSGNIRGYWASRDDHILTPPNYEAYKAYLAAKSSWRTGDNAFVLEQLNRAIKLDGNFIDPYFLMLDLFYNDEKHKAAFDTIQVIRKRFTELDQRQTNMLNYHAADVNGNNDEAFSYFLKEYAYVPKDLFTNNSAMVIAIMYKHNPIQALKFFRDIPFDSLQVEGCTYCEDRMEFAMWAALDADSMALADELAPKIRSTLNTRISSSWNQRASFGTLIMYYVWKNDTASIDQLITASRRHPLYAENWEYLNYLAGRLYKLRGNAELTSRYARKAIEAQKTLPGQARMLGKAYLLDNQLDAALSTFKIALKKSPDDIRLLEEMGIVYAKQGDSVEMKKIIDRLEAVKEPFDYGMTEYNQGRIYAVSGDLDKAVSLIGTAISKGAKYDLWITFAHDPDLMVLNDHPGYVKLMEKFK